MRVLSVLSALFFVLYSQFAYAELKPEVKQKDFYKRGDQKDV